jgi:hypothetical protein
MSSHRNSGCAQFVLQNGIAAAQLGRTLVRMVDQDLYFAGLEVSAGIPSPPPPPPANYPAARRSGAPRSGWVVAAAVLAILEALLPLSIGVPDLQEALAPTPGTALAGGPDGYIRVGAAAVAIGVFLIVTAIMVLRYSRLGRALLGGSQLLVLAAVIASFVIGGGDPDNLAGALFTIPLILAVLIVYGLLLNRRSREAFRLRHTPAPH